MSREVVYYMRESKEKRPVVTVCLCQDDNGNVARGVSICSLKDMPNKSIGRAIAVGRAIKALLHQQNTGEIKRWEVAQALDNVEIEKTYLNDIFAFYSKDHGIFKSSYNHKITEFEKKLLAPKQLVEVLGK